MTRSRVFKSCLMADLCFHCFVHFSCVPIYILGFRHKQCAVCRQAPIGKASVASMLMLARPNVAGVSGGTL